MEAFLFCSAPFWNPCMSIRHISLKRHVGLKNHVKLALHGHSESSTFLKRRIFPRRLSLFKPPRPCYTHRCRCAQRRGGITQLGWQPGKPDLTIRAKGADFTTRHGQTRRAGCVETRLSGSMEACWPNPPDLSSGRARRVIPAFYPIAIALKQGDADMPRWNSWQRLGHRGCVDPRRCASNFGRPKLRGKSAQGVCDYRVQAPGPFNLRWRGECPSW